MNRSCAVPPTRNHVSSASGWLGTSRPRRAGVRRRRSEMMSGNVMLVLILSVVGPEERRIVGSLQPPADHAGRERMQPPGPDNDDSGCTEIDTALVVGEMI